MNTKLILRAAVTLISSLLLTSCALFTDLSGDGELRFADSTEKTYEQTIHTDIVDGCFLNILFREANNRWVWTVEQWPFPACQHDFEYEIHASEDLVFKTTLNGYENFSWIVYANYDTYELQGKRADAETPTNLSTLDVVE